MICFLLIQKSNKVRSLNLTNFQKQKYNAENFAKMPNLHFLILDGCNISGNFGVISKELRWLQWKYMPLKNLPPLLDLSSLTSLDFSQSIELADMWAESNPALEVCYINYYLEPLSFEFVAWILDLTSNNQICSKKESLMFVEFL